VLLPVAGDDLGDGMAILRELPGWLQQARQRLVAQAVHGVFPQPDGAGDRNREAAALRYLTPTHFQDSLDGSSPGGPARTVYPGHQPRLGLVEKEEGVATHPRLHR
jgi:hypothetical protein